MICVSRRRLCVSTHSRGDVCYGDYERAKTASADYLSQMLPCSGLQGANEVHSPRLRVDDMGCSRTTRATWNGQHSVYQTHRFVKGRVLCPSIAIGVNNRSATMRLWRLTTSECMPTRTSCCTWTGRKSEPLLVARTSIASTVATFVSKERPRSPRVAPCPSRRTHGSVQTRNYMPLLWWTVCQSQTRVSVWARSVPRQRPRWQALWFLS